MISCFYFAMRIIDLDIWMCVSSVRTDLLVSVSELTLVYVDFFINLTVNLRLYYHAVSPTASVWAELFSPKNNLPLFAHVLFYTKNEKTVSSFHPKIIVFFSPMVLRFTFWKPLSQN
jgi:hypothetical protein